MKTIDASDLGALVTMGDAQPILHRQGDVWTMSIQGAGGTVQVTAKRGNHRTFKNPLTAVSMLRDAGYTGFLHIEV